MKNSLSVKTILRKDKKKLDGTYPLYYSIILNSKQLRLPVGKSINEKFWDKKSSYPKGQGLGMLTSKLKKREQEIRDFSLERESIGKELTLNSIKEFYNGAGTKDFYALFDEACKIKFTDLAEGTKYHYTLLRKQLKDYSPNLSLIDVDYKFCANFFHYLEVEKQIGNSGRATRRKKLVAIFEELIRLGYTKENPCKAIPRPKEVQREEYLTTEEVKKLTNLNLEFGSRTRGLEITRDLFLFSCYTGLRYSDVRGLSPKNIKENHIIIVVKKTKEKLYIPLTDNSKEILNKYLNKNNEFVFPLRENVTVNLDLKIIAKKLKISKRVSFHTARHTFGTLLAQGNVQAFDLMKLMGHKSVEMTMRYVNTDQATLDSVRQGVSIG